MEQNEAFAEKQRTEQGETRLEKTRLERQTKLFCSNMYKVKSYYMLQ